MSAAADAVHARLELMLAELRLPTVRRLAADVCAQSDREGWLRISVIADARFSLIADAVSA